MVLSLPLVHTLSSTVQGPREWPQQSHNGKSLTCVGWGLENGFWWPHWIREGVRIPRLGTEKKVGF